MYSNLLGLQGRIHPLMQGIRIKAIHNMAGRADPLQNLPKPQNPTLPHLWTNPPHQAVVQCICSQNRHSASSLLWNKDTKGLFLYVVEDQRRDDTGQAACLTACWTALCCCCLWDMLT
uniref:Cysteine-rich and transmembrane domain-containing protein 1 n=1 Tax=Phascolarctos cinereus TaxID=38626 RepID=A0A6P5LXJ8_PHACI|nr:cysteine-rich and transmembrane domain-containing protein 1 [Phascolarctos cinereus]